MTNVWTSELVGVGAYKAIYSQQHTCCKEKRSRDLRGISAIVHPKKGYLQVAVWKEERLGKGSGGKKSDSRLS